MPGKKLYLPMIDIEYLKKINHAYGHHVDDHIKKI